MPTTRELLAEASDRLQRAGVPSPQVDAELLLAHVTGRPRGLLRMSGTAVPDPDAARFVTLVERRAGRIPLQHLTGRAPFRHIEVRVGPGVFIPRPETELLVDAVLEHLAPASAASGAAPARQPVMIVDLCAGSAALAISLALEVPGSRVAAVEVSADALTWAADNVADHAGAISAAGSRLELVAWDATTAADPDGPLAGLRGQVDVVVSNPPYVPDEAVPREPEVRDHDPALALYGGADGLDVIRSLARQAADLLRPGGLLVIEHADLQGERAGSAGVPGVLRHQQDPAAPQDPAAQQDPAAPHPPAAFRDVADHEDLAGLPRYTSAIRAEPAVGGAGGGSSGREEPGGYVPQPTQADRPGGRILR